MSELEVEQRTNINFLVKLRNSGNEIRKILVQAYGDNDRNKKSVYKWVKRITEGRESVTIEEKSGRPQQAKKKKKLQIFVKVCVKIVS
jgi:transposase